jgi:hypothetical protein
MANLSSNTISVKYVIDDGSIAKAIGSFKDLTDEERKAILESKRLREELGKTGKEGSTAVKGVGSSMGSLGSIAQTAGTAIVAAFSVQKVLEFGKATLDVAGKFQKFAAILENTLGSNSAAQGALVRIQELAAKTPFSVDELTAAFVKLANQGFQPTNKQIIALGDLAASTGKSFDQLSEALIDAQVGEFERLKEFGIRAQKEGDKVSFTFKGVKTQVDFTNDSIRNYIVGLGDVAGVSGAMSKTSATLEGSISNLGDAWEQLLNNIGQRLAPVYQKAIQVTAIFLGKLKDLFQGEEAALNEFQGKAFNDYTEFFKKVSDQGLKNLVSNTARRLEILAAETKEAEKNYRAQELAFQKSRAKMQDEKGSGFTRQAQLQMEAAKKQLDAAKKTEAQFKASNEAAVAELKRRADAQVAAKAAEENAALAAQAQAKKSYEEELKLLDLMRQQQKIEAQLRKDKSSEMAAERRYAEEVYNLTLEYSNKGIGILAQEVELKKALRDKAVQDYRVAQSQEFMQIKTGSEILAKQKENSDKEIQDLHKAGVDRMLDASKQYEAEQKALRDQAVEDTKKAEELKQQAFEKSIELAQTLFNGFINLYNQGLDAQLSRIQKQYDEEIRLAGDNEQKVMELNEKKRQAEKEIKTKQFRADQINAVANVLFQSAPQIVKYSVTAPPLAAIVAAIAAAQTGFILAQPVPEFAKGTRGKAHKGKAIVGEEGRELVVTESGKTYLTPGTASLVDFKERSHILPADITERMMGSYYANRTDAYSSGMATELKEIKGLLANLPVHALELNERGFEKFIRTPRRSTKILNTRNG